MWWLVVVGLVAAADMLGVRRRIFLPFPFGVVGPSPLLRFVRLVQFASYGGVQQRNPPAHQGFYFLNEIRCFMSLPRALQLRGTAAAKAALTRPTGYESMEQSASGLVRTTARQQTKTLNEEN